MAQWHEQARRMKAENPQMTHAEIAEQFGVGTSAVWKALNPERLHEWRVRDHEKENARKRAWEEAHDRRPCPKCGTLMSAGGHRRSPDVVCRDCYDDARRDHRDIHRERIAEMWGEGRSMRQIAASLGWTVGHLSCEMSRMREDDWDLPHRYNVQDGKRVAA